MMFSSEIVEDIWSHEFQCDTAATNLEKASANGFTCYGLLTISDL